MEEEHVLEIMFVLVSQVGLEMTALLVLAAKLITATTWVHAQETTLAHVIQDGLEQIVLFLLIVTLLTIVPQMEYATKITLAHVIQGSLVQTVPLLRLAVVLIIVMEMDIAMVQILVCVRMVGLV